MSSIEEVKQYLELNLRKYKGHGEFGTDIYDINGKTFRTSGQDRPGNTTKDGMSLKGWQLDTDFLYVEIWHPEKNDWLIITETEMSWERGSELDLCLQELVDEWGAEYLISKLI